jgi:ribonuclease P protein component
LKHRHFFLTAPDPLRTLAAFFARARRYHETYISTQQSAPQAHPRLSRPHGYEERPQGARSPSREGPQASHSLRRTGWSGDPIGPLTFSARQRLRDKAQFDHVYKSGQRYGQSLFQAVVAVNSLDHPRLGLSIAARTAGNSVSRNRIRRIVRETFRLRQLELPSVDLVVSARNEARSASAAALRSDLGQLLDRVISKCARSSSRSSKPGAGS